MDEELLTTDAPSKEVLRLNWLSKAALNSSEKLNPPKLKKSFVDGC